MQKLKKNLGGRPKKLSTRDSHRIIQYMITEEALSTSHAAKLLQCDTGKSISKWTVQRKLHRNKFRAIKKKKKPLLSEKNRKARLDLVKKNQSLRVLDEGYFFRRNKDYSIYN